MNRKCRIPRRWIAEHVQLNREVRRDLIVGTVALNLAKVDRAFCAAMRRLILETVDKSRGQGRAVRSFASGYPED